jgi:pyridoxamine 5'-phosphate oxidase
MHEDRSLDRDDLVDDPIEQFRRWLDDADAAGVPLPNAMALATADADGQPSVRHVLLRGLDARGFAFYTHRTSRKGTELAANPRAALVFLWKELDRQVSVRGRVELVPDDESDAYFASRPRDAQLGAWASPQSRPLEDRAALDARLDEALRRFAAGDVPRPPHWGGYLVRHEEIEFWQGQVGRLHDRFLYCRYGDGWRIERLGP